MCADRWVSALPVFLLPWTTPTSVHSTSFILLIRSPGLSLYQMKCSVILLLNHTFPILVPILILKDFLHHISLACQSLSNLPYSCCTLMLPKNPAKISCSPLIFCIPLLTYLWANVNMAWVSTSILASSCFSSGNLLPEMSKWFSCGLRTVKNNSFEGGLQDMDILKEREMHCNRVQFLFKEWMCIGMCMCCL